MLNTVQEICGLSRRMAQPSSTGMNLTSATTSLLRKSSKRTDIDQGKLCYGDRTTSATLHRTLLETPPLVASRFHCSLSSARHFQIHLVVHRAVKIGAQGDNSKFAKLLVNQDFDSQNKFQNSIPAVPKVSGDQQPTQPNHWFTHRVLVSLSNRRFKYSCIQILIFPASKPAQRVFKIQMLFPSDVLCNEAGQGVLRQRVKNAVNSLNRDWNFCSYSSEGSRECKDININIKCDHYRGNTRIKRQNNRDAERSVYNMEALIPVER